MQTIDRASDLYSRYIKKLTDQETQLEGLREQVKSANEAKKVAEERLNSYVSNLNVE